MSADFFGGHGQQFYLSGGLLTFSGGHGQRFGAFAGFADLMAGHSFLAA